MRLRTLKPKISPEEGVFPPLAEGTASLLVPAALHSPPLLVGLNHALLNRRERNARKDNTDTPQCPPKLSLVL